MTIYAKLLTPPLLQITAELQLQIRRHRPSVNVALAAVGRTYLHRTVPGKNLNAELSKPRGLANGCLARSVGRADHARKHFGDVGKKFELSGELALTE